MSLLVPMNEMEIIATARILFGHYGWSNPGDLKMRESIQQMRDLAIKGLSAPTEVVPNGWKLVPLVPTDEMEKAASHEDNAYSNNRFTFPSESRFFNLYCAMLRTAPEPRGLPLEEFEKHLRGEPSAVSPQQEKS